MAKALLVIGNGFDLKIGLKSSFSQYLNSEYYKQKIEIISDIFKLTSDRINTTYLHSNTLFIPDQIKTLFGDVTFWDLYYAIPHICRFSNVEFWYDFESQLKRFISSIERKDDHYKDIITTDCEVAQQRKKNEDVQQTVYDLVLKLYLCSHEITQSKYYNLLINDLKEYEKQFGRYIELIQNKENEYGKKADELIRNLTDKDTLSYVNTFNYSRLKPYITSDCDIWYVNGDIEHPIFGVDYSGSDSGYSKWFGFSKTYRRLELDGNKCYFPKNKEYSKVIVYGHSLNIQDYNYFYALFNQLNLSNDRGRRNGYTVEFVYSTYNGKSSEEVRQETIGRVLSLFRGYNREILHEENFRLIDILFCNGAIKFREI